MLGDYRKLSTHNQMRQEPEIRTRVKMFKGKGRWLTTLLVAVGAAVAVQSQTTAHASTSDPAGASPETTTASDPAAVALQTAKTLNLADVKGEQTSDGIPETPEIPVAAAQTDTGESSKPPTDQNLGQPTSQVTSEEATQADDEAVAGDATETTIDDGQAEHAEQATKFVDAAANTEDDDDAGAGSTPEATAEPNAAITSSDNADAVKAAADEDSTTDATVSPEVKTAVDPVAATQVDTLLWTEVSDPGTISLSRTIENDGKSYTFKIKPGHDDMEDHEEWGYPLLDNTVTDDASQTEHTYTYTHGDTSAYYMRDLTKSATDYEPLAFPDDDLGTLKYETSTAADGTPYLRLTTEDATDQLTITETLSIDASGAFNHTVTVKNNRATSLDKVQFGTLIDTALDENDEIPIVSNGDGSATISSSTSESDSLTLYFTPTDNDTLTVGHWMNPRKASIQIHMYGDMTDKAVVAGTANRAVLASGLDTGAQFETPVLSLAPGATTSYSYSEHLYVQPITTSTITVQYQDEGHATLQPDTTTGGVVGSPFVLSSQAKTIDGYTYLKTEGNVTSFTKDPQTVTLVFQKVVPVTPQTATITYEDVTDGNKTLGAVDTITGNSDTTATYTTAERIKEYTDQGYKLVNDGTKDGIVFDSDDDADQPFVVQLAHDTVAVTPKDPHDAEPSDFSATATRVINYVNSSNPTKVPAQATLTQTATLTRTGTEDLVTKEVTFSGWKEGTVAAVDSPEVAGYTPDQATVQAASFTAPDVDGQASATVTVTYSADKQTAVVTFVDESGKQLLTPDQDISGDSDSAVEHDQIATNIKKVISQNYVLVNDGTVGASFDHNDDQPQKFTVVFGQVPKAQLTTTIVPKGPDGPLTPTTPAQVTGFPGDPISETDYPDVPGYTPNENQNKLVPDEPGDTTVEYTPNTQAAIVAYVDESGKQLITPDQDITGDSDTAVVHSQIKANIQKVISQNYVLISDGTVGATFDHNDDEPQKFKVVFGQVPKAELTTTIVPEGPDGSLTPTTPAQVTGFPGDPISETDYPDVPGYTPTENQNKLVPNEPGDTTVEYTPNTQNAIVTYVDESGKQLITPDQDITGASDTAVDHGQITNNIQQVIGQDYVLISDGTVGAKFDHDDDQPQKFTVVFGQIPKAKLTTTIVPEGPSGQLTPTTPVQVTGFPGDPISETDYPDVPGYTPNENQNKVVPNEPGETTVEYTPNTQTVTVAYVDESGAQLITPDQTINGDSDTKVDHALIATHIQTTIDQGYVLVEDGTVGATFDHNDDQPQKFTVVFGQVPRAELTTTIVPEGPNDQPLTPTTPAQVTGFPGDPISETDYPDVPGYTPTENQNKVVPNEPGDTTVEYTPNTQTATVTYVDEEGTQLITPDQTITGDSDTAVVHGQITANIQEVISQNYVLVSDGTVGATFDHDDDKPQKFTVVFGQIPKAELTTTIVPEGPDGPLTPTTPIQVTGFPGDPISETDYPDVPGYTPTENQNKVVPNEPGETTVEYTPNTQNAIVTYVDESGVQLITPDQNIAGDSDTAVDHSDIKANIQKVIGQDYVLVSDGTVGATFDHDDDQPQKFTVVFGQVPQSELTTTIVPEGPNDQPLTPTTPAQVTGFPGDPISETDYPDVPGYTPTENQNKVVPNEPGETTVEYTPNTQNAIVTYVDESGKTLSTPDQAISGDSDTPVVHSQITANIQRVIGQNYVLVSDGTVGAKFDHDDDQPQKFTVVFGQVPKAELTTTIVPEGPNGPLTPTTPAQVTGFPGDPISETDYPDVPGYTPSENQNKVVPNEPGETIVEYTPNTQTVIVAYVDKAGKQLITPEQILTGDSDAVLDHSQIKDNIQRAIEQDYVLISDGTVGATFDHNDDRPQKFTVVFGQVPKAELTTTIVPKGPNGPLTPTTPAQVTGFPGDPINETDYPDVPGYTPSEHQNKVVPNEPGETTVEYTPNTQIATVTYVDESGKQLITPDQDISGDSDTAVDHSAVTSGIQKTIEKGYVLISDGTVGATFDHNDDQPQKFTVVFGQVPKAELTTTIVPKGPNDQPLTPTTPVQVTGFPGDPISSTDYPDVPGYTPEENQNTVVPNEPGVTTVVYTANTQTATVTYVDEAGKQVITPDQTVSGKSDSAVDHGLVTSDIQKAIRQGYVLIDDGTVGATFDHNDDQPQKFTVVFGQVPKAELTTTIVPKGPNGPLTPTTPVQITGFPGDPIRATDYPEVPGYTPNDNQDKVVPNEPGATTVEYSPNIQTATIIYVDGSGQHLIPDQPIADKSDTPVDHAQIEKDIQTAISQGYNLVSDGTVGAVFDHDDDHAQIFTVVLSKLPAPRPTYPAGQDTPPSASSDTDEPELPSTFGGTTPDEPGQAATGGNETPAEPSLPATFGETSDGTATGGSGTRGKWQGGANRQSSSQANAKASAELPQTGDKPASGLAWLGATLLLLLGLADRRGKTQR
ncbi:mucin-binding protein [Lacticaseibacillus zhaodongensis]|uniref:mucin-binding protein n=1 Tax=Lacticaseibacillus zhaodongensis TaxID=2668065 RepID=UPI0012D2C102|nr:MucBP domain-containing protein [Lacticaseibacillus zhaodongensis]